VRTKRHDSRPVSISDAQPSFDETQRARKRTYAILMVIHVSGFALAGALAHIWWLALGIVALTGPLPWVAVVIANDRPPRNRTRPARRAPRRAHVAVPSAASRELDGAGDQEQHRR
jgi:hypothetical protein